ncbi:MAG: ATP-binding protein [Anaerolineae bacterium]|nr:ATP-binding protein [Anaerolineae bacterium]MDQ7036373.1 ATP-binding protein [Anaerolineae bacterium]
MQRDINQPTFEDLELLAEVSQLLTVVDLDSVLQKVVQLAGQAVGASKTSLFLHNDEHIDWKHIITMRDLPPDKSVKVVNQVMGDGFAGWVYRNKRGDIISDTEADDRWIVFPDDLLVTRSAMCVPFMYEGTIIAMITLVHEKPNQFRPYHLRLMEIIANQATIAIRNAQLFNRVNVQRQQLEVVLQAITDVLLVLDEHGKIRMVNNAALPLLGATSHDAVIGQALASFAIGDDVIAPIVEIIKAALVEQNRWAFETRSDHHQTDYQVTMAVWEDPQHEQRGYVVVMHNVTTLHDLSRFKDEMLRVATHDLRSPLALISGYADMVRLDIGDPEHIVNEYVNIIKTTTETMSSLVDDLLRVERVRASPLELREQTDMTSLVKVVIVNSRPFAKVKNITFETDIQLDGVPRIVADPVLIRQSMENLVSNAFKYTPENGLVTVRAHFDAKKFYFAVEDNGIGIPKEHQAYVFESFYRVEQARYKEKGSGLGLSLVKNVIVRHDGEVWVKSEEGKGSRFGFWLPLKAKTDDVETIETDAIPTESNQQNGINLAAK